MSVSAEAELARSAALEATIRSEVEAAGGGLTFARFMELALYHPELGYYRQPADRPTDAGDFLTAPESHPIFGWTLARQIEETWRRLAARRPFTLREYGAGSGTLALAILDGLRRSRSPLLGAIRYEPVELNSHRRAELIRRFDAASFGAQLGGAESAGSGVMVGTVLANEFLDALPVHRVTMRGGRLRELFVVARTTEDGPPWVAREQDAAAGPGAAAGSGAPSGPDAVFAEEPGEPSSDALGRRLADEGIELEDGQVAEICLAIEPWLDEVSAGLARGYLVVIDYGYPAAELYARRRRAGTLVAYRGHVASGDPFAAVGRQDLTAHVDFSAVRALAERRGFRFLGLVPQNEFLVSAGLAAELQAMQASPSTTLEDYTRARASVGRMLDPRALGRFRVLVMGRDVPPDPLTGLAVGGAAAAKA